MIAMGRKREDRGKEKKTRADRECNLDGEYKNPVQSFHDLTPGNIKEAIFRSRYLQLLLSLTLIGTILRFFNLGYNSLWLDEASTLNFAVKNRFLTSGRPQQRENSIPRCSTGLSISCCSSGIPKRFSGLYQPCSAS